MDRGRADRSFSSGLRVASRGDLIAEIHAKQRRRVIKRAAQFVALGAALLTAGVSFKLFADRRARAAALHNARTHARSGDAADLRLAGDLLDAALVRDAENPTAAAERALLRAHLWLEFGERRDLADAAVAAAPDVVATKVAQALLRFGDGDRDAAAATLAELGGIDDPLARVEATWLAAQLAIAAGPDDRDGLRAVLAEVDAALDDNAGNAALRRVRARLQLQLGEPNEALGELERARELARGHLGLAADEALFNAMLGRETAGVASVADQLLEVGEALPHRDRHNTLLARAVVHVRAGEIAEGMARLAEAREGIPRWDRLAVRLAIETALEAGDAAAARPWLDDADLPDDELAIDHAWIRFVEGDVMAALTDLAALPQERPRVAYVQALALVEQRRFEEAEPWIRRAEELLPGRVEIEVARARVELRRGDPAVALRKLQALAEEEPFAPRAWTGLGEALLLQAEPVDLRKAKLTLERAVEREPLAAEAMLLLAEIAVRRRAREPEGIRDAETWLTRAVETQPALPRYRERRAELLADAGHEDRARAELAALVDVPGVTGPSLLRYVELSAGAGDRELDTDALLERAADLGVAPDAIVRARARVQLGRGGKDGVAAAQRALAELVGRAPGDVDARVLLAETFARQFDRKAAELAIRRGFPHTPDDRQGRLYLAWADIEARMGKPRIAAPRARSAWLRLLDEDRPAPELLTAAELAARMWVRQDNERIALTITEQLTSRLPLSAEAWTIRAKTELAVNEAASARSSADRAIALDPDSARAHEIRGHCLLRFGQKDRARAAYERAVELAKGTRAEKDYRENLRRL